MHCPLGWIASNGICLKSPAAPARCNRPPPAHSQAPKLGKAEGRGITGGNTMQFSKSFRLSELGRSRQNRRRAVITRRDCQRFLVLRAMMPNLVTQELSTLALQLTAKRVLAIHDKICRSRPPCAILVTAHLIQSCRQALISR